MQQHITIAIDGPAGAGKSSAAQGVAQLLGVLYLDTGAMYRAVALYALRHGVNPSDRAKVAALLPAIQIDLFANGQGGAKVLLCGEDVSDAIRTPEVSMGASAVGAHPEVRARLVALQREIAKGKSVVMEGRDVGTHVLPNATFKFYITADVTERARRRWNQLRERGEAIALSEVLSDMERRDYNDSHREVAPLCVAPDAVVVDTTYFDGLSQTIRAVVDRIHAGMPDPPQA